MIVIVAGVSGSGKSTIGALLASQLGWEFEDGDALHPPSNIAKMLAGEPLTDEDRWPWLDAVGAWIDRHIAAGESGVIACSALKRSYRDRLRAGRPGVHLVFLRVDKDALAARLAKRQHHFFRPELLASQLTAAETPRPPEPAIVVDENRPPADVVREISQRLGAYRGGSPGSETAP